MRRRCRLVFRSGDPVVAPCLVYPVCRRVLVDYGARVLFDWASWCGLAVVSAVALLALERPVHRERGWIEWMRLALAGYWLARFLTFSAC